MEETNHQYVNVCCPYCENGGTVTRVLPTAFTPDENLAYYRCKECGHYFSQNSCVPYIKSINEIEESNEQSIEANKNDPIQYFGMATITIRFENRIQWQKYRRYILKTNWDFDGGMSPYTAHLEERFSCTDDVEKITKKIVQLLQMGFDIYSCKWTLFKTGDKQKIEYLDENGEFKTDVID